MSYNCSLFQSRPTSKLGKTSPRAGTKKKKKKKKKKLRPVWA